MYISSVQIDQATVKRSAAAPQGIIELSVSCARTLGVGMLAKSIGVVSWEEGYEQNPRLARAAARSYR
jgi:hypothetical protein